MPSCVGPTCKNTVGLTKKQDGISFHVFSGLLMYTVLAFYTFHTAISAVARVNTVQEKLKSYPVPEIIPKDSFGKDLKYILLWIAPDSNESVPIFGQKIFIDNHCSHINCFISTNKFLLHGDIANFDAIVFSISSLSNWKKSMPKKRSNKQRYIFYSPLPASSYPICNVKADNFFNWTWTYKLYSDIVTPFIEVKDLKGQVVAPKSDVIWNMHTIDALNHSEVKEKTKAVMWYNDNCYKVGEAVKFLKNLEAALKEHWLEFDMYGCDMKTCPEKGCLKAIEEDYYFYFVFEEVFSDDYVTTEVLKAYHHNAVPILMGGADYSKFLPPGSYIDARTETPEQLAALMKYTIRNPSIYNRYFVWRNFYTIHKADAQRGYCDLCSLLNNKAMMNHHTVYENFRKWWYYGSLRDVCFPKGAESLDDVLSYIKNKHQRNDYKAL